MSDTKNEVPMTSAESSGGAQQMTSEQLKAALAKDLRQLIAEALHDTKLEVRHIIDPSQCGFIVRRHIDGLIMAVLGFVVGFLFFAMVGMYFYFRIHH
jgi:hypothetical protein